jgi:hypothetical protein
MRINLLNTSSINITILRGFTTCRLVNGYRNLLGVHMESVGFSETSVHVYNITLRPLTRITNSKVYPCVIHGGEHRTVSGFYRSSSVFPCQCHSANAFTYLFITDVIKSYQFTVSLNRTLQNLHGVAFQRMWSWKFALVSRPETWHACERLTCFSV